MGQRGANPPLQTPDEADHYLRTYAISTGHFDFDASRTYPDDVAYLLEAFPGAWVNAHTSAGVGTDPDTGAEKAYNTAGYALKQYGKEGAVQSMADSFALYLAHDVRDSVPDPVSEPVSFLVIPFLPGAVGMALARLLGFGALGCLYGGRIVNLLHEVLFQLQQGEYLSAQHVLNPYLALAVPVLGGLLFGLVSAVIAKKRPRREIEDLVHGARHSLAVGLPTDAHPHGRPGRGLALELRGGSALRRLEPQQDAREVELGAARIDLTTTFGETAVLGKAQVRVRLDG